MNGERTRPTTRFNAAPVSSNPGA